MKHFSLFALLFVFSLAFTSCLEEENLTVGPDGNAFSSYQPTSLDFKHAYLINQGPDARPGFKHVILTEDEVFHPQGLTGRSDMLSLEIFVGFGDDIRGNFELNWEEAEINGTERFGAGLVCTNYNFRTGFAATDEPIIDGTAQFSKVDNETMVDYELTLANGREVTGSFEGPLVLAKLLQ